MKKLFATLAVASLTVAAFAQTPAPSLTFSGYFNTGVYSLTNGTDSVAGLWGQDAGKNGGRFNFNGKFVSAEGTSGVNFQIRSENWGGKKNDGSATGAFEGTTYLKSGYVWASFFDKLIYTQTGIINEQSARAKGDMAQSYTKEVVGTVVNVLPAPGLVVQAAVLLPQTGNVVTTDLGNGATTVFGGAYTIPSVALLQAQAKVFKTDVANDPKKYTLGSALFNASLLSVPNLKFVVETEFTGLGTEAKNSKSIFAETVDYGLNDFGLEAVHVGVISYQFLHGADTLVGSGDKAGLGLKINPWGSYKLDGGLTAKLGVTYFSGPEVIDGAASYTYNTYTLNKAAPTAADGGTADTNKIATLEIKPQLRFDFNASQSVTATYSYTTSIGAKDVIFLGTADAKSLHTFGIEYLYNF